MYKARTFLSFAYNGAKHVFCTQLKFCKTIAIVIIVC